MQAKPVLQDAIKKPIASPKSAQCHPLTFSYDSSPSGIDSNLLVLLHGLGDTHLPFQSLGKKLAGNLPQTAVLSLRAGNPIPFMEGNSWAWWDVWDGMGQEIESPNPSTFLTAFKKLLNYLTRSTEDGGCGWRASSIHLFGFAQGASAALEGAIAWTREQRGEVKIQEVGREIPASSTVDLGSIVSICGGLLSHPTFSPPLQVPVLHFHREDTEASSTAKAKIGSLRKAFSNVQDANFPLAQMEAMPQSQAEWTAIMTFWSKVVRNRGKWELDGQVYSVGNQPTATSSAKPQEGPITSANAGWSPTLEEKGS